ncbi:MAG: (5-formylfuran-3-yl)methyl phosphate synthase [Gammaproteobacteria bacterium]|nr:(5-formylfuran-3-yl)methyl phosphate synthase [Gammaproteobacteria bacterium]
MSVVTSVRAAPGLLASVRSPAEAEIALAAGVDIIDLKEPARGALGAVPHAVARDVLAMVNGVTRVSATIGDLHGDAARVSAAARAMAATGVDIIKVGLFDDGERAEVLAALAPLAAEGMRIVVVLLVDRGLRLEVEDVAAAGLYGAMLDTASKTSGPLTQLLEADRIHAFPEACRRASRPLLCGLAGSLRVEDIAAVSRGGPDYLGFRGALCHDGARVGRLSGQRVAAVRAALREHAVSNDRAWPPLKAAGGV